MARATLGASIQGWLRYYFKGNLAINGVATAYHDIDNNTPLSFSNAANTTSLHAVSFDVNDVMRMDRQAFLGARQQRNFYFPTAGGLVTQTFFIANRAMVITSIGEIHSTAETASGTATLAVFKDSGTQAPGGGTTTMVGTFNLKATANTLQSATLLSPDGNGEANAGITLASGDRLSIVVGGTATITALAGVTLTVGMAPGFKEKNAVYYVQANATIATAQTFFLANRDYQIIGVQAIWSTKGTTTTIDVTQESSTTAPAGGTTILSATIDGSTAANTVNVGSLTATAANLIVRAGNRLSLKLANKGALAGLVIVVQMVAVGGLQYVGQVDIDWGNTTVATEAMWIADRDYEIVDGSVVWATASGAAGTYDLTIDKGVTAPGGGATALASTVALSGTANTVTVLSLSASRRAKLLNAGDVLSVKIGSPSATAGIFTNISLLPR